MYTYLHVHRHRVTQVVYSGLAHRHRGPLPPPPLQRVVRSSPYRVMVFLGSGCIFSPHVHVHRDRHSHRHRVPQVVYSVHAHCNRGPLSLPLQRVVRSWSPYSYGFLGFRLYFLNPCTRPDTDTGSTKALYVYSVHVHCHRGLLSLPLRRGVRSASTLSSSADRRPPI